MDFFSLLKTKPKVEINIEPPKIEIGSIIQKINDGTDKQDNKQDNKQEYEQDIKNTFNLEQVKFKKGETIRVIYLEKSSLNDYKGYNGVIRDSLVGSDTCMVMLEALNSGSAIRFPKKHIIKWCSLTNTEL